MDSLHIFHLSSIDLKTRKRFCKTKIGTFEIDFNLVVGGRNIGEGLGCEGGLQTLR